MDKDKNIRNLQYKIDELEVKIYNFNRFNISPRKTEKLTKLKQRYENQLEKLLGE
ncbi:MAG: hypothetical protein ACOC22_00940 [bacterium]